MKYDKTVIMHSLEEISATVSFFETYFQNLTNNIETVCALKLCIQEALLNGFIHGNNYDKSKDLILKYHYDKKSSVFTVNIKDAGRGFDFTSLPDPTKEENILCEHGRGVFIIREYMDEMKYNKKGNELTFSKKIKQK